jgi:type IV pilus assembly protein PilA
MGNMLKTLKKRLKNQRGLTLVELLAVIVILGIISAIAVPSIGNIIQKSKVDAVRADAVIVLNAGKLYLAANEAKDTLNASDLEDYVDNVSLNEGYTVNVGDKNALTLTAAETVGDVTINFVNATLQQINDDSNFDSDDDSITVGVPASDKDGEDQE